jgi:hypothetical protein
VGNEPSEGLPVKLGLRQSCVMSPWLFNLFMNGVVREVSTSVMGRGLELFSCQTHFLRNIRLTLADSPTMKVSDDRSNVVDHHFTH